ncbi:hypothetical protein A2482_05295 [Candidatus Falkowbacteria bacterium RIFOXYC2_FULL_48_21]|uniref:Uncharacterized protein n=1 Tax=Candidatus Falkowbacteria bacterium RIFOXYC2_FULL_48_21 TaxID=1798005 RepID=A0A1F5T9C1_9BACT|nr:MAG: hypothetical protein A2482_05295 [Candidatus Falkowbacteria bacterium RIFOXYC2_FULL_48_21]
MTPGTIHVQAGKGYVIALHTNHSMYPQKAFEECALMPIFLMDLNKKYPGYIRPMSVLQLYLEEVQKRYKKTPSALTIYRELLEWLSCDLSFDISPEIIANWIILRTFKQFAPLPHRNEHGKEWDEYKPDIIINLADSRGFPQLTIKPNNADMAELSYPYFDEIMEKVRNNLFEFSYLYRFNRVKGSVTYSPDKVLAALIALEWERQQP